MLINYGASTVRFTRSQRGSDHRMERFMTRFGRTLVGLSAAMAACVAVQAQEASIQLLPEQIKWAALPADVAPGAEWMLLSWPAQISLSTTRFVSISTKAGWWRPIHIQIIAMQRCLRERFTPVWAIPSAKQHRDGFQRGVSSSCQQDTCIILGLKIARSLTKNQVLALRRAPM